MKHTKAIKVGICRYLGVQPNEWLSGMSVYVFEEEFELLEEKVFRYIKRHKNAYKEVGKGVFGNTDAELRKLAFAVIVKFGLKFKIDNNE